jgi:hypothetical protein
MSTSGQAELKSRLKEKQSARDREQRKGHTPLVVSPRPAFEVRTAEMPQDAGQGGGFSELAYTMILGEALATPAFKRKRR